MSEPMAEQLNPATHTCPICGYEWAHGRHSCTKQLLEQLAAKEAELERVRSCINEVLHGSPFDEFGNLDDTGLITQQRMSPGTMLKYWIATLQKALASPETNPDAAEPERMEKDGIVTAPDETGARKVLPKPAKDPRQIDIEEQIQSANPFMGKDGFGAVSAEDRLYCLQNFSLAQCRAALDVPGLQKSVEQRLRARIRKLEKCKEKSL